MSSDVLSADRRDEVRREMINVMPDKVSDKALVELKSLYNASSTSLRISKDDIPNNSPIDDGTNNSTTIEDITDDNKHTELESLHETNTNIDDVPERNKNNTEKHVTKKSSGIATTVVQFCYINGERVNGYSIKNILRIVVEKLGHDKAKALLPRAFEGKWCPHKTHEYIQKIDLYIPAYGTSKCFNILDDICKKTHGLNIDMIVMDDKGRHRLTSDPYKNELLENSQ